MCKSMVVEKNQGCLEARLVPITNLMKQEILSSWGQTQGAPNRLELVFEAGRMLAES